MNISDRKLRSYRREKGVTRSERRWGGNNGHHKAACRAYNRAVRRDGRRLVRVEG